MPPKLLGFPNLVFIYCEQLRTTPAKYLLRLRLAKAKQLLEQTELKVSEIAQQTGFATLHNIHRCSCGN